MLPLCVVLTVVPVLCAEGRLLDVFYTSFDPNRTPILEKKVNNDKVYKNNKPKLKKKKKSNHHHACKMWGIVLPYLACAEMFSFRLRLSCYSVVASDSLWQHVTPSLPPPPFPSYSLIAACAQSHQPLLLMLLSHFITIKISHSFFCRSVREFLCAAVFLFLNLVNCKIILLVTSKKKQSSRGPTRLPPPPRPIIARRVTHPLYPPSPSNSAAGAREKPSQPARSTNAAVSLVPSLSPHLGICYSHDGATAGLWAKRGAITTCLSAHNLQSLSLSLLPTPLPTHPSPRIPPPPTPS